MFQISKTAKKVNYNFEEPLKLNIIVDYLFSLTLWNPGEKRAKLMKLGINLNSRLRWGAQYP